MIAINRHIFYVAVITLFANFNTVASTSEDYRAKCVPDSTVFNDILGCYIDDYENADKKLNITYKEKMNSLSKNRQLKLKQSQRSWIKKVDSSCVTDEAQYGRESHFDAMQCRIDMTNQRIKYLKKY